MSSIQRRVALLIGAALAAMAFAAPAASADVQFEITDKVWGGPCTELSVEEGEVSGGCLIDDLKGYFGVYSPSGGKQVLWQYCGISVDIQIENSGLLYGEDQDVDCAPAFPTMHACTDGASPQPWPGQLRFVGDEATGHFELDLETCVKGAFTSEIYQSMTFKVGLTEQNGIESLTQTSAIPPNGGWGSGFLQNQGAGGANEVELSWFEV